MFGTEGKTRKAIAYYRHSAEDKQENSVPIQREQAQSFAENHNIEIIHEEADEGKSGLSASRPGFERLFEEWILDEEAPEFHYVLVLDVTRWGRFQDPDEAAYWEMQCKKRNIRVIYISRGFPKEEEKLLTSLETSIGRYMAAEYSRQLSDKVWHGSMKVSEQGFSAGGTAPYGYARVLLDENHNRVGVLQPGQRKDIANRRVTFEPAQDETPKVVQRIFNLFVNQWIHPEQIASLLNEDGLTSATGKSWNASMVLRILGNETYTGTKIYNKTWRRLKQKARQNPIEEWVKCMDAFEALVEQELFEKAQERLYWLTSSRWKRGRYKINKTERELRKYVDNLLKDVESDKRFEILRQIPVALGLTYYENGTGKRCFRITENMRKNKEVIGVSVNMFKDQVDAFFILPTREFGLGNYLVIKDGGEKANKYRINDVAMGMKLRDLCEAVSL